MMQQDQLKLQQHDIDSTFIALELFHGARFTQKYQTISQLLEHFSCKCIVLTTPGRFTLEVVTQLSKKDFIQELFDFFEQQIELWFSESKQHNPHIHRNSFYKGLQKGFEQKIKNQEKQFFSHQRALILSDLQELNSHFKLLYPRTTRSSTKSKHDFKSYFQGKNIGMRLELKNKLQQVFKLLN